MTAQRACQGVVKIETAANVLTAVAEVTSLSDEATSNVKSYFKMGNCEEQNVAGPTSRTVKIEGNYDPSDTPQGNLLVAGAAVHVEWSPTGTGVGKKTRAYDGVIESISLSAPAADLITFSASLKVSAMVESTQA